MHTGSHRPAGCMINMDAFSDCSDSDDERAESRNCILEQLSKSKCVSDCRQEDTSDTRSVSEPDAEATPDGVGSACGFSMQDHMHSQWQDGTDWMQQGHWLPNPGAQEWTPPRQDQRANFIPLPETMDVSPLEVSENSWSAKQRLRRNSCSSDEGHGEEEVVRSMKAILNKLTIKRFEQLYEQLLQCGIHSIKHVELLIEELFEKATTQHHFIDMYSDLCAKLHTHFSDQKNDEIASNFRKVLLRACQHSFEKNLSPPENLKSLPADERVLVEVKYKTKMLGNIKFVGALLTRKMLAGKVFLALVDELLANPTPEALETTAALLTAVGSTFDTPTWPFHVALDAVFCQVKDLSQQSSTPRRVRCLLADVLDLRAAGWKCSRPKQLDSPTTLAEVAQKKAQEEGLSTIAFLIQDAQRKAQKRSTQHDPAHEISLEHAHPPQTDD